MKVFEPIPERMLVHSQHPQQNTDKGHEVTKKIKKYRRELGKLQHCLEELHQLLGDFWKGKKLHIAGESTRDNSKQ